MMMNMALAGNSQAQTHFNLRGQYETFSFIAGPVNSKDASNGVGWITIKGDGKILYEYEIKQDDIAKRVTLDVTGVHQLSVFSEQVSMSLYGAIVDAWVYPAGEAPEAEAESTASEVDPHLKELPDVCKLISNIPPYSSRSDVDKQIYTGESDYITFSMGGTKFSEGFILFEKANFWDENVVSYAAFDLGNEFDYVSFTVGYVGKSWVMNNDKLMVYALLILGIAVLLRLIYGIYCGRHFAETHYRFILDRPLLKEMTGFAGWNLFGSTAYMLNTQGVNMLINIFFGVATNAARAIAVQVDAAVTQFVNNFMTAINPQITKSYAADDREYLFKLVCRGTKYSFFIMYMFIVPLVLEADTILGIWLKDVPADTPVFMRLVLFSTLATLIGNPMYTAIMATGKIRNYVLPEKAHGFSS